jgi:hypothetical protein
VHDAHGAQINFGDLTLYLTYAPPIQYDNIWASIAGTYAFTPTVFVDLTLCWYGILIKSMPSCKVSGKRKKLALHQE